MSTRPGLPNILLGPMDPADPSVAARIVQIQRFAYTIEADLMSFDGIPPLHETSADVQATTDLLWQGAWLNDEVVGFIAWSDEGDSFDIDRLAVDPASSRRGIGRALVRSVPTQRTVTVSTGSRNHPAVALYASEGFVQVSVTEVVAGVFTSQFRREPTQTD